MTFPQLECPKEFTWEELLTLELRVLFRTIVMSSKRPPETNRMRKIAGSFKGSLSSLLHLSRAATPSSIEMDLNSDNPTK